MACPGCGGPILTAGCTNADCAMSLGGHYVNGVKVATASGRRLAHDEYTRGWNAAIEQAIYEIDCNGHHDDARLLMKLRRP